MTYSTRKMASTTRSRMTEMSGAWFTRLSFHKALNSTEWFFFMIMARRKGAMAAIVTAAPNQLPQKSPAKRKMTGFRKFRQMAMVAMESTV